MPSNVITISIPTCVHCVILFFSNYMESVSNNFLSFCRVFVDKCKTNYSEPVTVGSRTFYPERTPLCIRKSISFPISAKAKTSSDMTIVYTTSIKLFLHNILLNFRKLLFLMPPPDTIFYATL